MQSRVSVPLTILLFLLPLTLVGCGPDAGQQEPLGPEIAAPSFAISPSLCTAQSSIPASECEALVALYNGTGGSGWADQTNWGDGDPCGWYGIWCSQGHVLALDLDHNNLTGSLPPELGDLGWLTRLDLGFNNLTGSIPSELGGLGNLWSLDLRLNQLSGSIPAELGNLRELRLLEARGNNLTGSIPPELGQLSRLRELTLTGNGLTGTIPSQLGDLSDLRTLYISGNDLTGSIPQEIANLERLEYLNVAFNHLTGSIPPDLGSLSNLQQMILGFNDLSGVIPPELGDLSELRGMGLNFNALTGPIPAEIGNLDELTYLNLQTNQLTGSIPPELSDLKQLESLLLDHNQLDGLVPAELGTLENLDQYFFLHANDLVGQVPLAVAEVGAAALRCFFTGNGNLFVPDVLSYRTLAGPDGRICGLPLTDPAQGFETQVNALVDVGILTDGQGNALFKKLHNAQRQADRGQTDAALAQMDAILDQIADFVADGVLSADQGQSLRDLVTTLRASLEANPVSWATLPNPAGSATLRDVWGLSESTFWVVGDGGLVLMTSDGGATWIDRSPADFSSLDLTGIWTPDGINLWATGSHPSGAPDLPILYSDDGGLTWTLQYELIGPFPPGGRPMKGVWGLSSEDVWAVGAAAAVLEGDGGDWTPIGPTTPAIYEDIWASDPEHVFAAGNVMAETTDGGASWSTVIDLLTSEFRGIWGSGATDVWAVGHEYGAGGIIAHNDGNEWQVASRPDGPLFDVRGTGTNDAFAVGDGGSILRYDGSAWILQSSVTGNRLWGVWVAPGSTGDVLAVGEGGTIVLGSR